MPRSKLSFTKLHLRIIQNLAACPYYWPSNQPFPITITSHRKLLHYKVHLAFNGIYPTVMFANYLLNLSKIETSEKMIALIFFLGYFALFFCRLNFLLKEKQLIQLITSFLLFEKNYDGFKRLERKSSNNYQTSDWIQHIGIAIIGSFCFPILVAALLLAKPCLVSHLGYILLTDHNGICRPSIYWHIPRMTILLFDMYMYSTNVLSATFYVFNTFFVFLKCLVQYLRISKTILKEKARPRAFPGKKGGMVKDKVVFGTYQKVQLLSEMFNDTFQGIFLPTLMIGIWGVIIVSLYSSVKLHESIPMPGFAFFPLATVESLFAVWIIKVAAGVLAESENCLEEVRRNTNWGTKSVQYKMMKSMAKVKVRFGSTNFVDHLTPFNMTNHALSNCATLMLLT